MIHHWDFFGQDAHKTAEHFRKHLFEFSARESFVVGREGFFSADNNHTCFWVEFTTETASIETQKRLRPKRSLSALEHESLLAQLKE
jgi:hypothetical protein